MGKLKLRVGIIGTGNIGCDLLVKIQKSDSLYCSIFAGRNPDSEGIEFARALGINTSTDSIDYIIRNPDICDMVMDATSAEAHKVHAPLLRLLNKFVIDLTPSQVGKMCIPIINLDSCLSSDNVNLITCGGQASIPIAYAICEVCPDITYVEVVATIASKSAGRGTRVNIDEFTQTTREALTNFTGVQKTKAIITLNPAEPPITMRNTIYAEVARNKTIQLDSIEAAVVDMTQKVKRYVPGYELIVRPMYKDGKITTTVGVVGAGDFLPKYAGNLDIITSAAVEVAEKYAHGMFGRIH